MGRPAQDLVHDGQLVEIKTGLGTPDPFGIWTARLEIATLRQLIACAMFDHSDEYEIRSLGVYSARYGYFVSWPLDEVLETLAGF